MTKADELKALVWAEEMAREIASKPREKSRPFAEFMAELRARAALSPTDGEEGTGSPSAPHPARSA